MPAVVAAVIAEVTDIGSGVAVRPAADEAPLGVGGMRKPEAPAWDRRGRRRPRGPAREPNLRPEGRRRSPREPWSRSSRTAERQRSAISSSSPYRSSWSRNRFPRQTARGRTRWAISEGTFVHLEEAQLRAALARSVEATPETRLAPERLCARRVRGARISAVIAAVVVLPLVAEISAVPSGSRAASRSTALGSSSASSLPGTVVPPAPTSLDSPAAARAAAIPATRGTRGRTS